MGKKNSLKSHVSNDRKHLPKSRRIMVEIYPEHVFGTTDNEKKEHIASVIRSFYPRSHFGVVLHDKDIYSSDDTDDPEMIGKPKKPHFHAAIYNPSEISRSAVAKHFPQGSDDDSNFVVTWDNHIAMFQYLIHLNNPDSFQYSQKCIFSNVSLSRYLHTSTVQFSAFDMILEFIDNYEPSWRTLVKYCNSHGLKEELRSNCSIIKDYLLNNF